MGEPYFSVILPPTYTSFERQFLIEKVIFNLVCVCVPSKIDIFPPAAPLEQNTAKCQLQILVINNELTT